MQEIFRATESVISIKYSCISLLFFGYNMAVANDIEVMIEFLVVPALLLLSSTSLCLLQTHKPN